MKVTPFDVAAAMHQSYMAQDKLGKALTKSADPALNAAGKRMVACASSSLEAYRRLFSGEAEQARAIRENEREIASFTAIHMAVHANDVAQLEKVLVNGGVDINAKTGNGFTAIALALLAKPQDADIVGLLIRHGADVASHGAVDEHASSHESAALLNLAVDAQPANPAVIALLLNAGANPFTTDSVNEYVFRTPFGSSFDDYESGKNTAILEQLLATGKLDPKSELAVKYLERAAEYPKVLERLIAHGISPERSKEILPALVSVRNDWKKDQQLTVLVARLLARYPALGAQLRGGPGFRAVESAVSQCRLELAGFFLDQGAAIAEPDSGYKVELLSTFLTKCAGHDSDLSLANVHRFEAFLARLKKRQYDVNSQNNDKCPAWLSHGGGCEVPANDKMLAILLDMGADPFLLYPDQHGTALEQAIYWCRMPAVDMLIAKAPQRLSHQGRASVELALKSTDSSPWEGSHCPPDFLPKTASRLKALLARR